MNPKSYMIIDTEHLGTAKMFITSKVENFELNDNYMWKVRFAGAAHVYTYRYERIRVYDKAEIINISERCIYVRGLHISGISELYKFGDDKHSYYHAICDSGREIDYDGREVYVSRTNLTKAPKNRWFYFKKLAEETGIVIEDVNILDRQFGWIDPHRDNIPIAEYLGLHVGEYKNKLPSNVIYPFGCNASQKSAVENALTNQVSIIQGPPGTGKTQTILNIISNLLLEGKTILVVSNNNSAVENVAEKLSSDKVGLGFLVAQLGRRENKASFIANQKDYPDMSAWRGENKSPQFERIKSVISEVSHGFEKTAQLAKLKRELDALHTEQKYNNALWGLTIEDKWLFNKKSSIILQFLNSIENLRSNPSIFFKIKWLFKIGTSSWSFLSRDKVVIKQTLESAYYNARHTELVTEIDETTAFLKQLNLEHKREEMCNLSLECLQNAIANRYKGKKRSEYTETNLKARSASLLQEYPIILSTTYSSKNCIDKNMIFDYVIMDEASQVDITTGLLSLSCASNAVIVGDDKQLPNVVDNNLMLALTSIEDQYQVEDKFKTSTHSFLESCIEVFCKAPVSLLREHYRCHPQIIEFCNQMFYDGQLVAMTKNKGEEKVIQVIRTVPGNHARGTVNQREIDIIAQEIMPQITNGASTGIISPYRAQAEAINNQLKMNIASTVHKYQGRECDNIIMSMVDNGTTKFSDDANLMNVAISRAKSKLYIVATGNELDKNSNLDQFIEYAKYNNFDVKESKLHSVFDLLYSHYTQERLAFEAKSSKISDFLSENLIYDALRKALDEAKKMNIGILTHYPLSRLISDWSILDSEQQNFAKNPMSHVDFLLYNTITKQPLKCIEVDGWKYHQGSEVQTARDNLKDSILDKYYIKPYRISTTQMVTKDNILSFVGW